jgi:hypothetical protein
VKLRKHSTGSNVSCPNWGKAGLTQNKKGGANSPPFFVWGFLEHKSIVNLI